MNDFTVVIPTFNRANLLDRTLNSLNEQKNISKFKVIISDNTVDQYESNLMRRICGLIYFSDKECAELKLKLINEK